MSSALAYARLYVDAAGESHFEPVAIETFPRTFAPPAPPFNVSEFAPASRYGFLQVPAGWIGERHPSPMRMWIFILSSEMEFEASDGQRQAASPGSALLLEDIAGKGHRSRVVGSATATLAVVELHPPAAVDSPPG